MTRITQRTGVQQRTDHDQQDTEELENVRRLQVCARVLANQAAMNGASELDIIK